MLSKCEFFSQIVFSFDDKNNHWPTFVSSFSAVYRVSKPGGYPRRSILLFQVSRNGQFLHIALRVMLTLPVGRWLVVNHKHDDFASTALTLVNVTKTTKLYGDEKEKEILVFLYIFLNVKTNVQVLFTITTHFYVYVNVKLYINNFILFTFTKMWNYIYTLL